MMKKRHVMLGLGYAAAGYLGWPLLVRLQLPFHAFIMAWLIIFFAIPLALAILLWNKKRAAAIGLGLSLLLLLPLVQFVAKPYQHIRNPDGSFHVGYRVMPGLYFYYESSAGKWLWVSH